MYLSAQACDIEYFFEQLRRINVCWQTQHIPYVGGPGGVQPGHPTADEAVQEFVTLLVVQEAPALTPCAISSFGQLHPGGLPALLTQTEYGAMGAAAEIVKVLPDLEMPTF